jgi:hypothetical protein
MNCTTDERLPLRLGAGLVIGSNGEPLLFNEKEARRRASKLTQEDAALLNYGFVQRFGRANPRALGIDNDPYWYATLEKMT